MRKVLLSIIIIFCIGFVSSALSDSLTAYYGFNEGTGTTSRDAKGNFNLTGFGTPGWTTSGKIGNATDLESGSSQYWKETSASGNFSYNTTFTINCWMKPESWTNYQTLTALSTDGASGGSRWRIYANATNAFYTGYSRLVGTDFVNYYQNTSAGNWYMMTYQHNATGLYVFMNGNFNGSLANSGAFDSIIEKKEMSIGAFWELGAWSYFYDGIVDECGYWSRQLSQSEISELYNSGNGNAYPFAGVSTTIVSPTNNSVKLTGSSVTFNVSLESQANSLANATLYINGVLNETISISGLTNYSIFTKTFSAGNYTWYVTACDTSNACGNSSTNRIIVRSWLEDQLYYVSSSVAGTTEEFGATLNVTSGITISAVNFVYDGVGYSTGIAYVGDQINLTTDFQLPTGTGNKLWYFNFTLSDASTGTTTATNISLISLGIDDCTTNTYRLYNFTVYDELDLTRLNATADNVNITLNAQLYDSTNTVLISNYSVSKYQYSNVSLCLENSLISGSTYIIDLELQYGANGYASEYYNILDEEIDVNDLHTNISLYDLDNNTAQAFKIIYKDSSFNPVPNAIIQVQRRYVGEGLFRTVEQPKTDTNGETIAHLQTNDITYTFIIVENGDVVATFSNYKAYCPNPTFTDCEISLNALTGNVVSTDYANIGPISFTLDVNTTTKEVTSIYSIRSGTAGTVTLNVTLFDAFGTTPVCNNNLTASSGTLSCTVPASFGNSTIMARLYYNGEYIGQKIVYLGDSGADRYGQNVFFIGLIIVLSLVGITFIGSPIIALVGLFLSLIVLVTLNIVGGVGLIGAGSTALWFILAIVIIIIKGANR